MVRCVVIDSYQQLLGMCCFYVILNTADYLKIFFYSANTFFIGPETLLNKNSGSETPICVLLLCFLSIEATKRINVIHMFTLYSSKSIYS